MEMLMSLQETLPAAEERRPDLSSLLLVLLHQRHFSTDWWKAKLQRQTAVFIAFLPQFLRTAVIRPLPHRLTSLNASDHSGLAFFQIQPTSSCHQSNVLFPSLTGVRFTHFVCLMIHFVCVFSGEQISLLMRHPDQPDNSKILKVAIIGAPNSGKSTLTNQLLGRKVFVLIVSSLKLHALMGLSAWGGGSAHFLKSVVIS